MNRTRLIAVFLLYSCSLHGQEPDPLVLEGMAREKVVDEGVFTIDGPGSAAGTEEFVIFQRPDGGYAVLSTFYADDDSYQATVTLNYDKNWLAQGAGGRAMMNGVERRVEVGREGGHVIVKRRIRSRDGEVKLDDIQAACDRECLIDLTPSALPMAAMARRYDPVLAGQQSFRWVAVSLLDDAVLLDGAADLTTEGKSTAIEGSVGNATYWRFHRDLKDSETGESKTLDIQMWMDAESRMRKFAVENASQARIIGLRDGDEKISARMPVR